MNYILKRLQEPSTFAGIAAFCASLGLLGLTEQDWNQLFGAGAAVTAAAAVLMKEKPVEKEEPADTAAVQQQAPQAGSGLSKMP